MLMLSIFWLLLLSLGVGACHPEEPKGPVNPDDTTSVVEATDLIVTPTAVTLRVGDSKQLTATVEPKDKTFTVHYVSDKPEVATVSDKGLITALSEGKAQITASVGKLLKQCVVTVVGAAEPVPVTLDVKTTSLSIRAGDTGQIEYTVTPEDTPVEFISRDGSIAPVDDKGKVTGKGVGSTVIDVRAADQLATVAVTVTNNPHPGVTPPNELPLLKFQVRDSDPEILAHEEKLGRKARTIVVGGAALSGFVNESLMIAGAVYEVRDKSDYVILGLSKESLSDCELTKLMVTEYYGFKDFERKTFDNGRPYLWAQKSDDPSITLRMFDLPNRALGTAMVLEFRQAQPLPKEHDLIATARDFPDYEAFATKEVSRIKSFEEQLDLRTYQANSSDEEKGNLVFMTQAGRVEQTNFVLVYYVSTPSSGVSFINCALNFISSKEDFGDPKIKDWLALNGYSKDYKADVNKGYVSAYDETGSVKCQLYIGQGAAMLQIFSAETSQAMAQHYYDLGRQQLEKMGL